MTAKGQLLIGLDAGYDRNRLHTNISNRPYTSNDPKAGFFAGIPLQYNFNRRIALLTEPSFVQKNNLVKRTGAFNGIYESSVNNYWQLPVTVRCTLGRVGAFSFDLDVGFYTAYWSSGRIRGATPAILDIYDSVSANGQIVEYFRLVNYDTKKKFDSHKDQRLEFGWTGGADISYQWRSYHFFAQGKYSASICDQQKKYMINQVPRYNETYYFSAGAQIRLDRKKPAHKKSSDHE